MQIVQIGACHSIFIAVHIAPHKQPVNHILTSLSKP